MCIVYQLTGGCNSNCRNKSSYRQLTPVVRHCVGSWKDRLCNQCGPAGFSAPPQQYASPPTYQPVYQPQYLPVHSQYAVQQQFALPPPTSLHAQGRHGGRGRGGRGSGRGRGQQQSYYSFGRWPHPQHLMTRRGLPSTMVNHRLRRCNLPSPHLLMWGFRSRHLPRQANRPSHREGVVGANRAAALL